MNKEKKLTAITPMIKNAQQSLASWASSPVFSVKNKPILTITCGLPRCGKSSWIKKNKGDAIVVCPDDIRSNIFGHQFHRDAEDFVWAFAIAMVKLLLKQGKNVIVDATNINRYSRECWIKIASSYGIKIRIVWLKTSIAECKRRNIKDNDGKMVPDNVIDRMAMMFEDPSYNKDKNIEVVEIPKNAYKASDYGNFYAGEMMYPKLKK